MLPEREAVTPQAQPELIQAEKVDHRSSHSDPDQNRGEGFLFGRVEGQVKSDIDLIRNAVARHARFPIPDKVRAQAAEWLAEVAASKRYDGRARVNAVKALADLDRLNMEQELRDQGGQRINLDVTSGGKPIGAQDYSKLTPEELERLIAERERGLSG